MASNPTQEHTTRRSRLRDLHPGIGPYETGPLNAITDVEGVRVGHETVIEGRGGKERGEGPVRTGVTIIEPRAGRVREQPCFAGAFSFNGNGEMTGLEWVRESGLLTTPIGLTNTFSVGVVRDALAGYDARESSASTFWALPVVGETYDGVLNDICGQHVTEAHVRRAYESASSGPVAEGNVGGGTGMICHGFKGGIGTSSRRLPAANGGWTVGVLVQANHGVRDLLRVDGVPVGRLVPDAEVPIASVARLEDRMPEGSGSIIVVVATDAPLLPSQCRRLATQATIGLGRSGGGVSDSSGDIMFAFSTGNTSIPAEYHNVDIPQTHTVSTVPHQHLSTLFEACADATEEAIINAMLAADDMEGRDGIMAYGLPADRLGSVLEQHATWSGSAR